MRRMLVALVAVSLGCYLLLFGLQEATENKGMKPEPSKNGILDMTTWNFNSDEVAPLDGQWEFYWNELLSPGVHPVSSAQFIHVPGFWRHTAQDGTLQAKGGGTYRLKVKLEPSSRVYGLRISNIRMASTVYVNGEKVGESGVPTLDQHTYEYVNRPYNAFFTVQGDTAEILIHVANFENTQGGIPYSLYFGSAQGIQAFNINTTVLNLTLIVSLLMLGCYQLSVYIIRKKEQGLLYFGLSCIVIAWSFASNGERIIVEYFDLPTEFYYKIQAISLYLSLITMVMFIQSMCEGLIARWFTRSLVYGMALYIAFVLVTPFQWYSDFNIIASTFQLGAYIIMIGVLLYSYRKERYGEFRKKSLALFIMALCSYLVGLFDYALYLSSLTTSYQLGYYAILAFCFLASFIMSYRFSEAYNTIENMAAKLQKADKQKDEFLLQTSHEFQTPLHGIINLSQNMLETGAEELNNVQMQNLSLIRDTSRRLSALVHDILDMEKIKRNELTVLPAKVDVRVTVSLVFHLFEHLITGKKIRLVNAVPDKLPLVYADENRLKQIIYNLVGNAAKFTQEGVITVSARATADRVTIWIEDSGVGIARSEWDTIFQPFEQAHSPYEYSGTGLGLFICRKLLHLMDGDIYIDWSEQGRGTRIAFTLPLADEKWDGSAEAAATYENDILEQKQISAVTSIPEHSVNQSPSVESRFTILAVDDETSNLHVLSRLFASEPYHILWANNGVEALELLHSRSDIDLVLLDVMMPRMSGFEVCREIRKQFSLFELPIILLTVLHSSSDIEGGLKAGANDFIVKPFDASEVRARTETLLRLKTSVEDAMRSELDFLQSQIKPHFLFNSLNSIMALCRIDPIQAENLITHLSHYLRRSFDPRPDRYVSLRDELQLVEAYVAIEQARFEDRLTVIYDVQPATLEKKILPLTIQPLVENAIRHGVMRRVVGGTVRLSITLHEDTVQIEVWDDGVGMTPDQLQKLWVASNSSSQRRGVGLMNIRRRLAHFCKEELKVTSVEGEWTSVRFQFKI
ncbi:hybrid sensor histidine kinase/response regulator [Paenibacillus cucumis (ex Kampfer et al. 2016)]|uniref:histidine kinase n=1 Tax=Paenibacillus cucumis (ex Kampfer et al. 2016) TaxID=1776858 RepID=A0ABS7KHR7_9BACL|nr:ATP-binding protein [Paenibacillus cucumis (ex Kampfer et al. 2016)]MBY0203708.1 response regulator [Paenibacillus cucumis (ex Kampfer et al. 2016)]